MRSDIPMLRYFLLLTAVVAGSSAVHAQQVFPTPQAAAESLIGAIRTGERSRIIAITGRSIFDVLSSGDDAADAAARMRLVEGYAQQHRISMQGDRRATLLTGSADVPFPIPLVRSQEGWQFDGVAGRIELLRARIDYNEAKAIAALAAAVKAQHDYAERSATGEGTARYAARIISRPGLKDGLYWQAPNGETPSPLHDFVERTRADGYAFGQVPNSYQGYRFKVLSRQGPNAEGGTLSYDDRGKMARGFALLAYPTQYGHSGVMTFMVNQSGVIYQKDRGAYATRVAERDVWFNPDQTWRKVTPPSAAK